MEYQLQLDEPSRSYNSGAIHEKKRGLTLADVITPKQGHGTLEIVNERAQQLKELLKSELPSAEVTEPKVLAQVTQRLFQITELVSIISNDLHSLISNQTGKDAPGCSVEVGKLFYPGILQSWSKKSPLGKEKILSILTEKYLEAKDPDRIKELNPTEKLLNLHLLFAIQYLSPEFPEAEYYVRLSAELADKVARIDQESKTIEKELAETKEMNAKARANSRNGKALFEDREVILAGKLSENRAKVPALFPEVSDVSPLQATDALKKLAADIVITPTLLSEILRAQVSLERLIAVTISSARSQDNFKLYAPCIKEKKYNSHSVELTKAHCEYLKQSPEIFSEVIQCLGKLRELTRGLIAEALKHPSYSREARDTVRDFLQEPFQKVSKSNQHDIFVKLLEHPSAAVQVETCQLLTQPVPLDASGEQWGYALEKVENLKLLKAVINAFLTSPHPQVVDAAKTVLSATSELSQKILAHLVPIRKVLDKKKPHLLGITFDDELQKVATQGSSLECLTILTGLQVFAENADFCPYVKLQIPNIDLVKEIVDKVSKQHEDMEEKVQGLGRVISRGLSHSLADYFLDEDGEELREFIDDYRYYQNHPDILSGVAGNLGIRSAMLIYGPPGTGKTHFVECLENELGIPCHTLSASEKAKGEDKIDYLKKTIEEVKDAKKHCILLIDEAESTVLARTSPIASTEDRHVTNYLLQEINELRKNHPYVMIVVATNYIDRIDDAIIRPGRVDILFEMKPMSEKGRKGLIQRELSREKIDIELDESDWERLMDITEGFIPICISQTIVGTNRIYLGRLRESEPEAEFDKELLFKKLNEEAKRYRRFQELTKKRADASAFDS